jgi:hypothetical protein
MGIPIEVTDNIKECIEILDSYINGKGEVDKDIAVNAMKYLNITVNNAMKSSVEAKGCPNPKRIDEVK